MNKSMQMQRRQMHRKTNIILYTAAIPPFSYLHSSHARLVLLAEPQAKHEKCEHVEGVFLLQV